MLSEISQTEEDITRGIIYIWNHFLRKKEKSYKQSRKVVNGGNRVWQNSMSFELRVKSEDLVYNMVTIADDTVLHVIEINLLRK